MADNGLGYGVFDPQERKLRQEIITAFTGWTDTHKKTVFDDAAACIGDLRVLNQDVELEPIANKLQCQFASEHIVAYDQVFREGVQRGIDEVRGRPAFERQATEPRGFRGMASKLINRTTDAKPVRTDPRSEDYQALLGYYSHSAKLTSHNEQVNSATAAKPYNDKFDERSGYAGFQSYCSTIRQEARQNLLGQLGPQQTEAFPSQFDSKVDMLWQKRFTAHSQSKANNRSGASYDQRSTRFKTEQPKMDIPNGRPEGAPHSVRTEQSRFREAIHIPTRNEEDVRQLLEGTCWYTGVYGFRSGRAATLGSNLSRGRYPKSCCVVERSRSHKP